MSYVRRVESAKERARRKKRLEKAKKAKAKKKIRFKRKKRASQERNAKRAALKNLTPDQKELVIQGLCPTCRQPYSVLQWHHILPRKPFPELIFEEGNSFIGCESPRCGGSLDRDPHTGLPLTLPERIKRILELLGFSKAMYARRKCRGRKFFR